jgi:signal transduction histidine kinase
MRIRSRLLILVLAVVLPALVAAGLGIGYVYSEAQKSYRQSMRETTRALALVVDKEISEREAILRTLAASPFLDEGDIANFYTLAKRIAPSQETTVILSDASGTLLLNTRLPFGMGKQPRVTEIQELRRRKDPEATVVSNVYFAPVGKNFSFSVEVPVARDGRILYYLEMGAFASHLQEVFEDQKLSPSWTGTIVDRNGVVVARSKNPEAYVGKRVSERLVQQIQTAREGFRESANSLSGEPVIVFFSRAPDSEWSFVVSVPQSEVRGAAVRAAAMVAGIALLLLGLAVAGAYIVGRSTARQIEALRLGAEQLGRGESVGVERSGIVEMDAVNSAMVRASTEIRSGKAELERQVAEAVAAAERSQRALLQGQKLEALGRLTGGIAHDFNNVLQTLTTGLDVVHFSTNNPAAKKTLGTCQRAVQRAADLVRQLMVFGRVQDARLETVNLPRQIEVMTPLLKGALRSDIHFHIDITDGVWPVTIDPLQLELALLNLVINARDAMSRGGILKLAATNETVRAAVNDLLPGDYVRVSVTDSGEGMSQEVLAQALDPFFTTKGIGRGSGMGLPQAYGFAKQAGGTLLLQSRPGEGTAALLYLPKAGRAVALPEPATDAPARTASGESVLFVEDDPLVRDVVGPALKASGFHVVVARDGEEAVDLLQAGKHFDLLLSDIVMPGRVSGIDLAEFVRQRFPAIRVLLATGYSDRRISLPGIRILAKPYNVADVVDALNEQMKPTES